MATHLYGVYDGYWAESRYPDYRELAPRAASVAPLMNVSQSVRQGIVTAAMDAGIDYSSVGAVPRELGISRSENHRGLPGTGHVDFPAVAAALAKAKYSGTLVIESFVKAGFEFSRAFNVWRDHGPSDVDQALRNSLAHVKRVFRGAGTSRS
jgi:hypothetical protein